VDVLTIASMALQGDLQRMDVISQNLANASTTGYKRQIHVQRPFGSFLQGEEAVNRGANAGDAHRMARDMRAGALRATGVALDVAIDGDGYFEVMTDKGVAYTRQGQLRIDARGRLATAQGAALMGKGGELSVTNAPLTIQDNGDVLQDGRVVGQIKLQRFDNPSALVSLGDGLFHQGGARVADKPAAAKLRAGYLENANVNSTQEMIHMMETLRHFEALQKTVQGYDSVLQRTMQKLGEF